MCYQSVTKRNLVCAEIAVESQPTSQSTYAAQTTAKKLKRLRLESIQVHPRQNTTTSVRLRL